MPTISLTHQALFHSRLYNNMYPTNQLRKKHLVSEEFDLCYIFQKNALLISVLQAMEITETAGGRTQPMATFLARSHSAIPPSRLQTDVMCPCSRFSYFYLQLSHGWDFFHCFLSQLHDRSLVNVCVPMGLVSLGRDGLCL